MSDERRARSWMLKPGSKYDRTLVLTECPILAGFHHTDDFIGIPLAGPSFEQPATHCVLPGPELIRHCLIDDGHKRGAFAIGRSEFTTPQEDGSHRGEVARSEERRVGKECRSRWSP